MNSPAFSPEEPPSRDFDFIEEPDRLILRATGARPVIKAIFYCLLVVLDLALVMFFFKEIGPDFWPAVFGNPYSPIALCLFFASLAPALLLSTLTDTWLCKLSIHTDGWVRKGIAAWRFPGPMNVSWDASGGGTRGQGKTPYIFLFQLNYGSSRLLLDGCRRYAQTLDCADRINRWARQRIAGIPDAGRARRARFSDSRVFWGLGYFVFFALLLRLSNINGYYLNAHAAPGAGAANALTGFLVLALAAAIWRWARMARREMETGKVVWMLDGLAVLLLVAAGAIFALRLGQVYDLRARPAQEVTLRQPACCVWVSGGRGCSLFIEIAEPALGRSVRYDLGACDQRDYWKAAKTVEVRQQQSELGVRILSVRRVEAK